MCAYIAAILVLLITFEFSLGYDFLDEKERDDDNGPLPWPETFHLKGEIIDLTYGLVEPFEFWTDGSLNRSRIDFYNGIEKSYYYGGNEEEESEIYQLSPTTTDDNKVKYICITASFNGTDDFLPSLDKYEKIGTEKHGKQSIERWQRVIEDNDEKVEETMYISKAFSKKDNSYVAHPVKYVKKVLNLNKGSVGKHVIINYYNVEYEFSSNLLNVEEDESYTDECQNLGGITEDFKNDVQILKANTPLNLNLLFQSYINFHSKSYDIKEHEMRKSIFHKNWRMVNDHNRKDLSYRMELNEFADRTEEELGYLTATYPSDPKKSRALPYPHTQEEIDNLVQQVPREYDLRIEGLISPVKNQASCGSCWAFCTTATLEGAMALKNGGRDLNLSEQSLVDCAWPYGNGGCQGGQLDGAMAYVVDAGIPTDREYGPYMAKDGLCHRWNMTKMYQITGFAKVTPRNINAMKVALVKYGPVVAAIHASQKMKMYSNGIFYDVDCNDNSLNHGITVVGYGERDGDLYWIVKNSWGEAWGEDGYILLSANDNNCFLTDEAYFVVP